MKKMGSALGQFFRHNVEMCLLIYVRLNRTICRDLAEKHCNCFTPTLPWSLRQIQQEIEPLVNVDETQMPYFSHLIECSRLP